VACSDDDTGTSVVLDGGADAQGSPRADGGRIEKKDSEASGDTDAAEAECDDGNIVINELEPAGDGGAEFVELFNANSCALSLGDFKLLYRSGANVPSVGSLHAFGAADAIRSHTFLLFANDKFVGKRDGDLTGSMGNAAGQVALVNDVGDIVDAVGYGDVTDAGPIKEAGAFTEKKAVPLGPNAVSVGRKKDGVDTDDNAADFKSFTQHTSGVSNE
jgi:hypothetical protein